MATTDVLTGMYNGQSFSHGLTWQVGCDTMRILYMATTDV